MLHNICNSFCRLEIFVSGFSYQVSPPLEYYDITLGSKGSTVFLPPDQMLLADR